MKREKVYKGFCSYFASLIFSEYNSLLNFIIPIQRSAGGYIDTPVVPLVHPSVSLHVRLIVILGSCEHNFEVISKGKGHNG